MCVYDIEEISQRLRPAAEQYGIDKITLFGSYARGNATEESDVDLMISYRELIGSFALGGVFADFKEALKKSVDIVSEEALLSDYAADLSKGLYDNIKREGIVIYGKEY